MPRTTLFALVVASTVSSLALAQATTEPDPPSYRVRNGGDFGLRKLTLFQMMAIQEALQLSELQKKRQTVILKRLEEQWESVADSNEPAKAAAAIRADAENRLLDNLEPVQRTRVDQIQLQLQGPSAFALPDLPQRLGMSGQQITAVRTIADNWRKETDEAARIPLPWKSGDPLVTIEAIRNLVTSQRFLEAKIRAWRAVFGIRDGSLRKIKEILSQDQLSAYQEMLGKPFDLGQFFQKVVPTGRDFDSDVQVLARELGLADQRADPNFDAKVARPVYALEHPAVLFDEATGQVLMPDGSPAAGAIVRVAWYQSAGQQNKACKVASRAIADNDGRFTIESNWPLAQLFVTVKAPGATADRIYRLKPGLQENRLQLIAGAKITGRVLHKARGVEGVTVGISGASTSGDLVGNYQAVTDRDGRFVVDHVFPDMDFRVFVRMDSMVDQNLASGVQEIRSPPNGQTVTVGELNLHPAHLVRGRLMMLDGKRLPAVIFAVMERANAADLQEIEVDRDGSFVFWAVPSESMVLSFHTMGLKLIRDYRLSSKNRSVDPLHFSALRGRVDDDLELKVLLVPGSPDSYSPGAVPTLMPNRNASYDPSEIQRLHMGSQPLTGFRGETVPPR